MIKVVKSAEPQILVNNKNNWLSTYLGAKKIYKKNKTPDNKKNLDAAEKKYNHKSIRLQLSADFCEKCAYCESHITHITFSHIEHFRPKSKYPKKCFEWKNLMIGCSICNGKSLKSDKFPTASNGGPLIDVTKENPDNHLDFIFDSNLKTALVIPKTSRGAITIKTLGLNRPMLVRHRSKVVRMLVFIAIHASQGDQASINELVYYTSKENEYSAFAKMLCRKFNITF
jgi:uncharacterized protein (TIGR02646 family)